MTFFSPLCVFIFFVFTLFFVSTVLDFVFFFSLCILFFMGFFSQTVFETIYILIFCIISYLLIKRKFQSQPKAKTEIKSIGRFFLFVRFCFYVFLFFGSFTFSPVFDPCNRVFVINLFTVRNIYRHTHRERVSWFFFLLSSVCYFQFSISPVASLAVERARVSASMLLCLCLLCGSKWMHLTLFFPV